MATNKKLLSTNVLAQKEVDLRAAIAGGQRAAEVTIAFRAKQRLKRAAIAKALPANLRELNPSAPVPAKVRAMLRTSESVGVLIAEGDSWFDYPLQDVLRLLEDDHLYNVESVAHRGDCVEDMAHSTGQFEKFARRLEKLLRDDKLPRAILLSGGGNDIAGAEFAILLNYATSTLPPLNEDIVRGVIDVRLKVAYASILSGLTAIAKSYLGRPIPIVTHGYDYPIPDGRGFLGGWWKLPGPWLKPAFLRKEHEDIVKNTSVMIQLIDRFNTMLEGVSALPEFAHVQYLDLRGTLKHDGNYKKHWGNEMHPSTTGFDLITKKFANLIDTL